MKELKTMKAVLTVLWPMGKLCGMYLCVLAVAVLGNMRGAGIGEVLGTLATTICCAAGGLALFCVGQAAKELLAEVQRGGNREQSKRIPR